jgi:hypothetical protein
MIGRPTPVTEVGEDGAVFPEILPSYLQNFTALAPSSTYKMENFGDLMASISFHSSG